MTVVLASSSPRRSELLTRLGVTFEVIPSRLLERSARANEDPESYARYLAGEKAATVAAWRPESIVIGADTVVTIDGLIMGKPLDFDDALRMLRLLRGRTHQVITAVVLRGVKCHSEAVSTNVSMRNSSDEELSAYIRTGEPMDRAGSYAIQGGGGNLVMQVHGCYETVVGLPLCACSKLLRASGIEVACGQFCRHLSIGPG